MVINRPTQRREMATPGWIDCGLGRAPCVVMDVSERGAKLAVQDPGGLPATLRLYFSPTAQTFRSCAVRWRGQDSVGVEFLKPKSDLR
jgi:hypothetical protein